MVLSAPHSGLRNAGSNAELTAYRPPPSAALRWRPDHLRLLQRARPSGPFLPRVYARGPGNRVTKATLRMRPLARGVWPEVGGPQQVDWMQLVAAHQARQINVTPRTAVSRWQGETLDYGLAVEGLLQRANRAENVSADVLIRFASVITGYCGCDAARFGSVRPSASAPAGTPDLARSGD